MKKLNMKVITTVLFATLLAAALPALAFADASEGSTDTTADLGTTVDMQAATLTDGWTQCGTCEWQIDAEGVLTIRPLGNGSSGTLALWEPANNQKPAECVPWYGQQDLIRFVQVKKGVAALTCYSMFAGCKNLISADLKYLDTSAVETMEYMFFSDSSLTQVDLSTLDTSQVTDMSTMFSGCSALLELDVSHFDTSSVTDAYSMFVDCASLSALNISNFDTSHFTSMVDMFRGCSGLKSLDVSNFDTSNVEKMAGMFTNCAGLTSLDLSSFDTSKVTSMLDMFNGCTSLKSLKISHFDTQKVTTMSGMFEDCSSLTALDLTSFKTTALRNMSSMFANCGALETIYASSNFTTAKVNKLTGATAPFLGCVVLVGGSGTSGATTSASDAANGIAYACVDGGTSQPGYFTTKQAVSVNKTLTTTYPYTGETTQVVKNTATGAGGTCVMVAASDGTAATKYPITGNTTAFKVTTNSGYLLRSFNVSYTSPSGKKVTLTVNNGLTRVGAYSATSNTYEFSVPNAKDLTINVTWISKKVAIHKTLTCGNQKVVDAATSNGGTCTMVATQSGIAATKYPLAGNTTAFKVATKAGYTLKAFNVTYTTAAGKKVTLTNGNGLTRVGAYSATANTYEFKVPGSADVTVNVTWTKN